MGNRAVLCLVSCNITLVPLHRVLKFMAREYSFNMSGFDHSTASVLMLWQKGQRSLRTELVCVGGIFSSGLSRDHMPAHVLIHEAQDLAHVAAHLLACALAFSWHMPCFGCGFDRGSCADSCACSCHGSSAGHVVAHVLNRFVVHV